MNDLNATLFATLAQLGRLVALIEEAGHVPPRD